ncbi:methyl-accepting chemotaxis protein [Paenibacillus filicis]|uniref:Methyl-accepting chemotaxis protein n=1 Tax=Paenibacillus gyeongsangnamensis TaxID=3388067 RepID=A0ABT4Q4Z5_9BACL|nr:methyl-accepting chemotaxis protein [Paenibacillus filicis]MCZ8511906.1 methyl-accepting chemotaxis protein [Paenibacillus filicis]
MNRINKLDGSLLKRSLERTGGRTLKGKLIAGLSGIMLMFLLVGMYNLMQVHTVESELQQQNDKVELKLMALELKEMVQELNIIASGLEISKKTEYISKYNEKRKLYDSMIKRIGETADTDEKALWRSKLLLLTGEYTNTFDTASKLIQDKNITPKDLDTNMEYLYNESQRLMGEIFTYVDQFYVSYSKDSETAIARTKDTLNATVNLMIAAFILAAVSGAAIGYVLIRSFTAPIQRLQHAVGRIAAGDLTHTIQSQAQDELGMLSRGFDHMVREVRSMLTNTQSIASSLSEHSRSFREFSSATALSNKDIVRAIQEISTGAEQQAHQSEQSSYIITELEEQLANISSFTDTMQRKSREAAFHTHTGSTSMAALGDASKHSETVLYKVYASMEELSRNSAHIGKIVASITDISAQTNVLALNAAIEAARAGVHGRGFSVIADEVRQLSAQTNESSKTIAKIVQTLQSQMSELDAALSGAKQSFEQQNAKMSDSHEAFQQIRVSMDELSGHIDQIHLRITDAKSKNASLVESVQYVAAIAEETAASVQEVNSSSVEQDQAIHQIARESDDILTLAQQLFSQIQRFQIAGTDEDTNAGGHPPDAANPHLAMPAESEDMTQASDRSSSAAPAKANSEKSKDEEQACKQEKEKELVPV